jgi:hypothetical protein
MENAVEIMVDPSIWTTIGAVATMLTAFATLFKVLVERGSDPYRDAPPPTPVKKKKSKEIGSLGRTTQLPVSL